MTSKYYLIDENQVRRYFWEDAEARMYLLEALSRCNPLEEYPIVTNIDENQVRRYFLEDAEARIYLLEALSRCNQPEEESIVINGVQYDFDIKKNLSLISAQPVSEKAFALTTEGLVEWANPSRTIYGQYSIWDPIEGYFSRMNEKNEDGTYYKFCSGYICLESTPPSDAIRIKKDDIIFQWDILNLRFHPEEGRFKIEETENKLIINPHPSLKQSVYYIGTEINSKYYVLSMSVTNMTKIITKGTCFNTNKIPWKFNEKFVTVCYE